MSISFDKPIFQVNQIKQIQTPTPPTGYGFVIIRNVSNDRHNLFWQANYSNIRKYYPPSMKIMIVDDNSDINAQYKFNDNTTKRLKEIDASYTSNDTNLSIYYVADHAPELLGAGEILGYYMFKLIKPEFKYAVVIHDSAIINKYVDFTGEIAKCPCKVECIPLWDFEHHWDNFNHIAQIVSQLDNNTDLIETSKDLAKWYGCFGIMSIVSAEYLDRINNIYGILNHEKIKILKGSRDMRMGMERVWGLIYYVMHNGTNAGKNIKHYTPFGNIHEYYSRNGYNYWYDNFEDFKANKFDKLPIVKVWNSR